MAHQVIWAKMNVFDADGNPTVLKRGQLLPDGIDAIQVERLSIIGAVQFVEDASKPEPEPAADSEPETPEALERPAPEALKPAWIEYASDPRNPNRISRETAESMSKADLVKRFNG